MKKKVLLIGLLVLAVGTLAGCAYKKQYAEIYEKELEAVFGEYQCEELGKQHFNGYDGLGAHDYYAWEITYRDAVGEEKTFTLRNDEDFDFAIGKLYEENLRSLLTKTLLAECVEAGSVNDTTCSITYDVDLEKYHYSEPEEVSLVSENDYIKEGDYKYFNMAAMDGEALIEAGVVTIQQLRFSTRGSYDTPPTDEDMVYFKEVVKEFEELIPVEQAYYEYHYTDHSGWKEFDLKEEQVSESEEK